MKLILLLSGLLLASATFCASGNGCRGVAGCHRTPTATPTTAFIRDTFTGADGTALYNHLPDVGGTWEGLGFGHVEDLVYEDGVLTANQIATATAGGVGRSYRNAAVPPSANYNVSADIVITDLHGQEYGLTGRVSPTGTASASVDRYLLEYNAASPAHLFLCKFVAGTFTLLDDVYADLNGTYRMTLTLSATGVSGVITNGTTTLTVASADTSITQVGRAGIEVPSPGFVSGNTMDNFTGAQ